MNKLFLCVSLFSSASAFAAEVCVVTTSTYGGEWTYSADCSKKSDSVSNRVLQVQKLPVEIVKEWLDKGYDLKAKLLVSNSIGQGYWEYTFTSR